MNVEVSLANLKALREETAERIASNEWATYEVEQSGETEGPVWVTVMFAGADALTIRLAIRVYVRWSDSTSDATDAMEEAVAWIDERLTDDAAYRKPEWTFDADGEAKILVAVALVDLGREDR